jgi:hypothetical protein
MLKAGTLFLGLTTGVYIGVYLREQGYTSGLTRAYYAYKNVEHPGMKKNKNKNKNTIDDVYELYKQGKLDDEDLEKFKTMIYKKRYDKLDEMGIESLEKVIGEENAREVKRVSNSNIYEK